MAKRAEGASVKFDGISFRLNEKERRILAKKAEDLGKTPSKTAKLLALEGKIKVMFKDAKAKEIITSLSRIGNNVNQIAKKLNADNAVDDSVKSQFDKIQSDLDIIMDFIILGKKPPKSPTTKMKKEKQETTDFSSSSPSSSSEETEMKKCVKCNKILTQAFDNDENEYLVCPICLKDSGATSEEMEGHTRIIVKKAGV